jgi:hypothetical protein
MNRNKLKTYAPQARREFIQAVTDRAAHYGLSAKKIEPMTEQGDVALIGGRPFPKAVGEKRKKLEARIQKLGFGQTMEAMAYTWFNRLVAIRFMELHGYLEHGYRVLSARPTTDNTDSTDKAGSSLSVSSVKSVVQSPEILEKAQHVELPGLDKQRIVALKLDGTKEEELYRLLLVGQCNALHKALPFLFEAIDDETELLLPDHLLHSDSLIRKLVSEVPEEDWQEVEIIGWLYQFYISEKKDEVIGKVVKSEDIPAATQLFTPNWIVKYLVQNSLGRQWVATYPNSPLKGQMEYYIEPAEQTPEVQAKLAEITPTSLNPEELTLLDPACGSGHILTESYDLLQRIYQERGYRAKDIPRLILEKNLFGLEIDDRSAQLAAFALMMKARADDRSIFERDVQPHVLSIQESKGLDAKEIYEALQPRSANEPSRKSEPPPPPGQLFETDDDLFTRAATHTSTANCQLPSANFSLADVAHLISLFEHGKTFGSLIQVPENLAEKLPALAERVEAVIAHGGIFEKAAARTLRPLVVQAQLLACKYDAVVANPPYMGGKYFAGTLKDFVAEKYKEAKADLYACFIQRNLALTMPNGVVGMITIPNWMFLSSFDAVRRSLFDNQTIDSFVHNGRGVFGSDFGSCSFVIRNNSLRAYRGVFRRLFDKQGSVAGIDELKERFFQVVNHHASPDDFKKLPGEVIAYWSTSTARECFSSNSSLSSFAEPRQGLATSDDGRFVRLWHEVPAQKLCLTASSRDAAKQSGRKWFPFNKGGPFRRWYGNLVHVVNWEDDGRELLGYATELYKSPTRTIKNISYYFRPGITWSNVTISTASFRQFDSGVIISHVGPGIFLENGPLPCVLGYVNSPVANHFLELLSPTAHFEVGQIKDLPFKPSFANSNSAAAQAVELAREDWNSFEVSWGFQLLPLIRHTALSVELSLSDSNVECTARLQRMTSLEEENNRFFIEAYGLQDELSPEVPDDQITLYRPDREEDIKRLLSYAIGCMMGRYSLDEPGLIYADSGNEGFDPSKYRKFHADEDGVIPFTEFNWFPDDAASRFEKFIATAWPAETLEENLKFVAESLGPKKGETPRDTIRRYLANDFYKHHLSMYKKRPIYWLFSSGKQRGFQALVYLHRYNEGTLARMRTEYVIPLLGKMTARIANLTDDSAAATSSQHKKRLETEKATITKQLAEVQAFDEQLRHFADQRIKLDLDDGVKVNYGKFGDLLAEVKTVCGKIVEEE